MSKEASNRSVKKTIDKDESRRNRTDQQFEIRKSKKEEQMNKKRQSLNPKEAGVTPGMPPAADAAEGNGPTVIPPDVIQKQCAAVFSDNNDEKLKATQQFRRLLSIERSPPIQQVIECGVVPYFVEFLGRDDLPPLQFEAAWALTNIASGTSDHTHVVIEAGAVPVFVRLLMSPNEDVREQAAWALGNVAGDSVKCRDLVLANQALPVLLQVSAGFTDASRLSTIRNTTWTLSNLCRGKPAPNFELVKGCLPLLAKLTHTQDLETITDACWALSYLSDGPNERIQAVLNTGIAVRLIELLGHSVSTVQTPALRTVGNIVTGDDRQTQYMLNLNVLGALGVLLDHPKKNIRKEACWTLSNVTAGNSDQIGMVIAANVFPKLIVLLRASEFDIQKEAAWALSNATSGGTAEQLLYLAQHGALPPLCDLLVVQEPKIISVALEGIENILKAGQTVTLAHPQANIIDQITSVIEECGGLQKIEDLQNHENTQIYERSLKILEQHFGASDEVEDAYTMPTATQGQGQAVSGQMDGGQGFNFQGQAQGQAPPAPPAQYTFGAQNTAGAGDFNFGANPPQPPSGFGPQP